ncbi:ABC transporter permease [Arsenicicoccus sp. oral taxon 190]|uniref:ABC transporter permease n=1 Tax=Arsenicicoccus sp. oral taxon 190 TaxID=1658671 RepID=UPI000679EAF0|nr:ABC transporter permease [Arsenicicoccus sp. oral taxon 190]AKT51698.1 ABC transporter permease [Arsenicicoccus sp. oral taxon 190]
MLIYVLRRLANYLVMIFVTTTIAYFAAVSFLKPDVPMLLATPRPTPESVRTRLASYDLDPQLSAVERYWQWLQGVVLHWDWGRSPNGQRLSEEFVTRALVSGRLVFLSMVLSIVIGIALGIYTASRQYRVGDKAVTYLSYFIQTIPAPVLYLVVQMGGIKVNETSGQRIFYVSGISSAEGTDGFWAGVVDQVQHLVLPTLALTILGYVGYQLLQRSLLLDNIGADYVRTARAKGLTKAQAVRKHALRTSFIPVAQTIAFAVPSIFAGTFIIETVFAWQGLGRYTLDAITRTQDVNVTVASMAFGGLLFAIGAIIADISVAVVDPRVRVS